MCLDNPGEFVVVELECRPPPGAVLYSPGTIASVGDGTVNLSCGAGDQIAVSVSRLLVPVLAAPASSSQSGFCCSYRGTHSRRMREVIISSSGDSFAVREKHTNVQATQLAAAHKACDLHPGSEVLCKNASDGAYFPAVVSAVMQDAAACTLMKQTGEKRSVGFGRVLEQPNPEVLRDGARVLWSANASCKSFRPAVIGSLIVALDNLALPADRGLLEPGCRVFCRRDDDGTDEEDSGSEPTEEKEQREPSRRRSSQYSAATVTEISDEAINLDVEVAWSVPFEALKPPIVPLDRHAIVVGTKVRYQYSGGGSDFWPATVTVVHDDGTFDLLEDDNEPHESVGIDRIFSHGGSLERASLRVGSQVQYGLTWIAATVAEVNEDGERRP